MNGEHDDHAPAASTSIGQALAIAASALTGARGGDFLQSLANACAKALDFEWVLIGALEAPARQTVQALAVSHLGAAAAGFRYTLAGSPCEQVVGRDTCIFPSGVAAMFPKDVALAERGIESYAGARLYDSAGQPIGVIAAMDRRVRAPSETVHSIMEIFAAQASVEMDRSAAWAATRESEARLKQAQRVARVGTWTHDLSTGALTYSDEAYRILGWRPKTTDLTLDLFYESVHPDDLAMLKDSSARAIQTGTRHALEHRIVRPNGEIRWVYEDAVIEGDAQGQPARLIGTVQDVTLRKQAEDDVRSVLDNLQDAFYRTDVGGRVTMISRSIVDISGFSPDEIIGRSLADFYADPDDRQNFLTALQASGGQITGYEARIRNKDGGEVWVATSARYRYDAAGKFAGVEGTTRDIDRQKRAEAALRRAEEMLREGLDALPVALAIYDSTDRLALSNENYRAVLLPNGEMVTPGTKFEDLVRSFAPVAAAPLGFQDAEDYIYARVHSPARTERVWTFQQANGRWTENYDRRTASGGHVAVRADITERKLAEEALQRAEEMLHEGIEALPVGFAIYDAEDRLTICNENYRETMPTSSGSIKPGVLFEDLVRPSAYLAGAQLGIDDPEEYIRMRVYSERRSKGSWLLRWPNGRVIETTDRKTASGGHISVRRDITQVENLTEALKLSEEMLREGIEALPVGFSIYDADDKLVIFNKNYHNTYVVNGSLLMKGTKFEDIIRASAHLAGPQRGVLDPEEHVRQRVYSPLRTTTRWLYRTKDGKIIETYDHRTAGGGYISVRRDITELETLTDALKSSEEMFRQMAENISEMFWVSDPEARTLLYVSPAYEAIWGRSRDAVYENSAAFIDAIHPDDRDRVRAAIFKQTEGGFDEEVRIVRPDGDERRVRAQAFPVRNDKGDLYRIVGVAADVTDERRREAQLRQAQKMEAVGQLTGGVAHDFNNLLAVIMGNAELVRDTAPESAGSVDAILRAAGRGAELTQRLLAFSRQQPLRPKSIDLHALASGMLDLLSRTLGETIAIETHIEPGLWDALADAGQVENALLNLALNARDAMPQGGRLDILGANRTIGLADVEAFPEVEPGDYIELAVRDTGQGMTPEVQAQAFEPFFTTKDVGQGSGLGLSMIYGFARQSGGHATIESQAGQGTTVRLYLPRAGAGKAVDMAPDQKAGAPQGSGETILVLEDNEDVRALAVMMLEGLNYRVLEARDAAEARAALREAAASIDLVLSDVVLPGGASGPEFVAEARAAHPGLKVVFMSGYSAEAAGSDTLREAGAGYLSKPFRRADLAKELRKALS